MPVLRSFGITTFSYWFLFWYWISALQDYFYMDGYGGPFSFLLVFCLFHSTGMEELIGDYIEFDI